MSNKDKSEQNVSNKVSKKAQKQAKQQEKFREKVLKSQKKQFTELGGLETTAKEAYSDSDFVLIKSKKVQEYAEEIESRWSKQSVKIVGFGKQIPKAITCAQIFKKKIGVYDDKPLNLKQVNKIKKDQNGEAIMEIAFQKQ